MGLSGVKVSLNLTPGIRDISPIASIPFKPKDITRALSEAVSSPVNDRVLSSISVTVLIFILSFNLMAGLTKTLEILSFAEEFVDVNIPSLEALFWIDHGLNVIYLNVAAAKFLLTVLT